MYQIRQIPAGDRFANDPRGPWEIVDEEEMRIDFATSKEEAQDKVSDLIRETRAHIRGITAEVNDLEDEKADCEQALYQLYALRRSFE